MLSRSALQQSFDRPRVNGTLVGPLLVLAEAERSDCVISMVLVSRYTDSVLICRLERALRGGAPIEEIAARELTTLSAGQKHGGVVAILHGRPRDDRNNDLVLHLLALRTITTRRG